MREEIRNKLYEMSDAGYQEFSASLIPASGRGTMLGVRLPALRTLAKEIAKGDFRKELSYKEDLFFEETMLRGMILGYGCKEIQELFSYLEDFIPRVQNWSVCDSVCNGLKLVEKHPEETWNFLMPYLESGEEFKVRVVLIMLLSHFIKLGEDGKKNQRRRRITMEDLQKEEEKSPYLEKIMGVLDRAFTEGDYAQMAAAWLLAELFVTYPVRTFKGLQTLSLDDFTKKKAVQKIRESRIPEKQVKEYLRQQMIV